MTQNILPLLINELPCVYFQTIKYYSFIKRKILIQTNKDTKQQKYKQNERINEIGFN